MCERRNHTLWEWQRLRLKTGCKGQYFDLRNEVTGGLRKIRNEERSNSYYLQVIVNVLEIREDEMVLNVACMGQLETVAEC